MKWVHNVIDTIGFASAGIAAMITVFFFVEYMTRKTGGEKSIAPLIENHQSGIN